MRAVCSYKNSKNYLFDAGRWIVGSSERTARVQEGSTEPFILPVAEVTVWREELLRGHPLDKQHRRRVAQVQNRNVQAQPQKGGPCDLPYRDVFRPSHGHGPVWSAELYSVGIFENPTGLAGEGGGGVSVTFIRQRRHRGHLPYAGFAGSAGTREPRVSPALLACSNRSVPPHPGTVHVQT
jgi:hypothetical protein